MPIQGLNFSIQSGFEGHQSYQSTGSFIVYNPNDGVAFVATDRTATGLSWDYKVPSQSGGKFPGPINSYLSIFYLDQSGGGAAGQIVVYASPESVNIPYFWSIGRAIQLQSTSLDIVGGPQPGNPGAGIGRLWIDTGGHLNVLQPSGANFLEIDSNNLAANVQPLINATPLAGDVVGTLANTLIQIRQNSAINVYDASGNLHPLVTFGGEQLFWAAENGNFRWVSQGNTAEWMRLDTSGNLVVANNAYAINFVANTALFLARGVGGGIIYWESTNAVQQYWDGTYFHFNRGLVTDGAGVYLQNNAGMGMWMLDSTYLHLGPHVVSQGNIYMQNNAGIYFSWNGTALTTSHPIDIMGAGNSPGAYLATPARVGTQICLYDNANGNCFGIGINNSELTLISGGSVGFRNASNSGGLFFAVGNNGDVTLQGPNSRIYWHPNGTVYTYQNYPYLTYQNLGISFSATPGSGYAVITTNVGGTAGSMMAVAYNLWSSVEHARQYGAKNVQIQDPLALVRSVTGYYYDHISFEDESPRRKDDGALETTPLYGFSALEVSQNIPELSSGGGVDNGRMVTILWEAVKELDARVSKLEPVVP